MADPKDRLVELRAERARLVDEREKARAEATNDLIAGKKPANTAAALAERIAIVDDAIERLTSDASDAAETQARAKRTRQTACSPTTGSPRPWSRP